MIFLKKYNKVEVLQMKKIMNYVLLLSLLTTTVSTVLPYSNALAANNNSSGGLLPFEKISVDNEVDELYAKRRRLALEFSKNAEQIAEIDKKLAGLGIVEITYDNLMQKLLGKENQISKFNKSENAEIQWKVSSTKTVKWTSERKNMTYNGKEYQLQIVRGVPKSNNSELSGRVHADSLSNSGFRASAKNVIQLVAPEVLGSLPAVGGTIKTAQTFYDVFHAAISGLQKTTNVGNVECSYTTSLSVEEIYIFVKYRGAADLGNQIPCYIGNSIEYDTTVSTSSGIIINGRHHAKVYDKKYNGTMNAPYYGSCYSRACINFWNYKQKKGLNEDYRIKYFQKKMISDNKKIQVPSSAPQLSA